MEVDKLIITYYDKESIWPKISRYILSKEVKLPNSSFYCKENENTDKIANLEFLNYKDFVQESNTKHFDKPLVMIYLLNFTTIDNFREKSKQKLQKTITKMNEKNIEWVVLLVHPIAASFNTQNNDLRKVFNKISSEINVIFGNKRCCGLHCCETKSFITTDTFLENYSNYTESFFKLLGETLNSSLEMRVESIEKLLLSNKDSKDYWTYFLLMDELAVIYSAIGLKKKAEAVYDYILHPNEIYSLDCFNSIKIEDLQDNTILTFSEYRKNCKNLNILYLKKYVYLRQRGLLESSLDINEITERSLNFLFTCMNLLDFVSGSEACWVKEKWVYSQCLEIVVYITKKSGI